MIPRKRKNRKFEAFQEFFFAFLITFIFLSIAGFLVFSNVKMNKKRAEMTNTIEDLQKELQALEDRNAKLKAGISEAGTETFWEEKIREQGYKKPGEEAIVVLPPEENQATTSVPPEKNFWEKIIDRIGL